MKMDTSDVYPKILNPELYFIKNKRGALVYSPYFNAGAKLNKKQYAFLMANKRLENQESGAEVPELLTPYFYIDEARFNSLIKVNYSEKSKLQIKNLTLIMTSLCNLRCKYCYIFGGDPKRIAAIKGISTMGNVLNPEIALKAIEYFNPKTITFFGWGEPTLAFDQIKRIVEGCSNRKIKYTIDTNGVYYKRRAEIVKYLMEHKIKMQISYDGIHGLNDEYRIDYKGNGSSQEILETIKEIKKYGELNDMAYVRITACNGIEDKLEQSLDYLKRLGFNRVRVEPVLITGRAKEFALAKPNMTKLAVMTAKAAIHAKEIGIRFSSNLLPSAGSVGMTCKTCNYIMGGAISLGYDNKFYMCVDPLPELCVGEIKNSPSSDFPITINAEMIINMAKKRNVFKLKECQTCPVKCGGGCTKESFYAYGDFDNSGENIEMCNSKRLALAKYLEYVTK